MLRYWQRLGLMEHKPLSQGMRESMATQSTPEQWFARGAELFNRGNYKDAGMCFSRAGGWLLQCCAIVHWLLHPRYAGGGAGIAVLQAQ